MERWAKVRRNAAGMEAITAVAITSFHWLAEIPDELEQSQGDGFLAGFVSTRARKSQQLENAGVDSNGTATQKRWPEIRELLLTFPPDARTLIAVNRTFPILPLRNTRPDSGILLEIWHVRS